MKKLILPFVFLVIIILLSIISCGPYVKKPVVSHVLAVTAEGDTILVAIDQIRPNILIIDYPIYSNYNPYYMGQYNYRFRYPYNGGYSHVSSNNTYRVPPPAPKKRGTTSNENSGKSISRIDYDKAANRGAAGKPRK